MYTLARGAVHGAAFGLAVAGVETWLEAWRLMASHSAPPVWLLVRGAALAVGLGAMVGTGCAVVLRLRHHGLVWHRLAVALVWAGFALATMPATRPAHMAVLGGPVAGLGLVPLARWLAFKWRWDPVLLGLVVVAAGIVVPEMNARWK